jgi:mRNA-capping enzyme
MLEKEVIEPRNQERYQGKNPYYRYDMEPFRVCISDLKLGIQLKLYLSADSWLLIYISDD